MVLSGDIYFFTNLYIKKHLKRLTLSAFFNSGYFVAKESFCDGMEKIYYLIIKTVGYGLFCC